jgi:hypothetical protein
MKKTTVIPIRIIDPMGKKVNASERIDSNNPNPVAQAFRNYCARHKGEFSQGSEFILAGEGFYNL